MQPAPLHIDQDAVDRAQRQDASGATQAATRLWTAAQSILCEGLAQPLPPSLGLEAAHSNTQRWRGDMQAWLSAAEERLRRGAPLPPAAGARGPPCGTVPRSLSHPTPGSRAAAPPPLRSAVSQPSGAADKEERAYEDRILTEVLDDSPAVGWDDVAGLAKAKQVPRAWGCGMGAWPSCRRPGACAGRSCPQPGGRCAGGGGRRTRACLMCWYTPTLAALHVHGGSACVVEPPSPPPLLPCMPTAGAAGDGGAPDAAQRPVPGPACAGEGPAPLWPARQRQDPAGQGEEGSPEGGSCIRLHGEVCSAAGTSGPALRQVRHLSLESDPPLHRVEP